MKKIYISIIASVLPFIGFSQIKVDANGHVGIASSASTFSSSLAVGSNGESGVVSKSLQMIERKLIQ